MRRHHYQHRVEHHHSNPWMAIGWICLGAVMAFFVLAFVGMVALLGMAH